MMFRKVFIKVCDTFLASEFSRKYFIRNNTEHICHLSKTLIRQINIILSGVFSNCYFMKVVSFFSRFAIVCNIAFLLFIFLGEMEARKPVTGEMDRIIAVSYVKDIVITLGVAAIIINILLCTIYAILIIIGRQKLIPKSLAVVNCLFLILQFLYFFYR